MDKHTLRDSGDGYKQNLQRVFAYKPQNGEVKRVAFYRPLTTISTTLITHVYTRHMCYGRHTNAIITRPSHDLSSSSRRIISIKMTFILENKTKVLTRSTTKSGKTISSTKLSQQLHPVLISDRHERCFDRTGSQPSRDNINKLVSD